VSGEVELHLFYYPKIAKSKQVRERKRRGREREDRGEGRLIICYVGGGGLHDSQITQ